MVISRVPKSCPRRNCRTDPSRPMSCLPLAARCTWIISICRRWESSRATHRGRVILWMCSRKCAQPVTSSYLRRNAASLQALNPGRVNASAAGVYGLPPQIPQGTRLEFQQTLPLSCRRNDGNSNRGTSLLFRQEAPFQGQPGASQKAGKTGCVSRETGREGRKTGEKRPFGTFFPLFPGFWP